MKSPAISVIIPVYNQEKYVGKCIRSVLGQSFQDFEVIIINDGSTDKSLEICQRYAKKDFRISIIDKQNMGVTFARRDGLLKASGEYICFLDSDDYLADNALEILYGIARTKKTDLIIGSYDIVYDNWGLVKKKAVPFKFLDTAIPKDQILTAIIGINGLQENLFGVYVWGRLYRRLCILNALVKSETLMFPYYVLLEDAAFNYAITPFIKSVWISSSVVHHYRCGGVTSRDFPCVREAASLFDTKFEFCFLHNCESVLPRVLNHYTLLLLHDITCQIHFGVFAESEIHRFAREEFANRKIVLWAQNNTSLLHDEMDKNSLIRCIVNNDVDGFLYEVKNHEKFLKKHHYWKSNILKCYQKVTDAIYYYSRMFTYLT